MIEIGMPFFHFYLLLLFFSYVSPTVRKRVMGNEYHFQIRRIITKKRWRRRKERKRSTKKKKEEKEKNLTCSLIKTKGEKKIRAHAIIACLENIYRKTHTECHTLLALFGCACACECGGEYVRLCMYVCESVCMCVYMFVCGGGHTSLYLFIVVISFCRRLVALGSWVVLPACAGDDNAIYWYPLTCIGLFRDL